MFNKVILIGRLSKEVELRYTTNGNANCSFTLAVDRKMKNSQGEKQTDFIQAVVPPFRGKLAELCANYLDKGKLAMVEGEIHVRSYEVEGQKRWVTEVEVENVKFLTPKGDSNSFGHEVNLDDDVPF